MRQLSTLFSKLLPAIMLVLACSSAAARGTYQTAEDFLSETFPDHVPEPDVIWLTGERKEVVNDLLGHRYSSLRVRYWSRDKRSAWILEEIGKEQPITAGFVIDEGRLEQVKVLVFRESRGWEVRHPFFTDQFKNGKLNTNRRLDRNIDGISGATLSVRAMKKLATLALFLDSEARNPHVTPPP